MSSEPEGYTEVSWEIIPPEGRRAIGGPAPLGSVRLWSEDGGVQYISVPAGVARSLLRLQKQDELHMTTKEEVSHVVRAITLQGARARVADLINRRDYSEKEVRDKLRGDGYPKDVVHEVLEGALRSGLVDDERFATSFIRSKVYAGWGLNRIERELSRRGVQPSSLEGWPYDYVDPDEEWERALEAASRKHVREPNAYAKLVRFLVGRGYSYDLAKRAAAETLSPE